MIDPDYQGPARPLVERLLEDHSRARGQPFQVFMLTSPDDPGTTTLEHPILNTSRTASGKPWAWTLGQRYTTLERLLRNPETTTELDALVMSYLGQRRAMTRSRSASLSMRSVLTGVRHQNTASSAFVS